MVSERGRLDRLQSIIDADFDESILAVNLLEHEYRLPARDREIVSVFDRFGEEMVSPSHAQAGFGASSTLDQVRLEGNNLVGLLLRDKWQWSGKKWSVADRRGRRPP